MDDTTQGKSEAAAAIRKRRSSILKAARQSRAPLSELEFNAPTPPADAKSRRVSFSRRNNVAEFVTNEATTTWKNLYEEHNRTLESSGNESAERPRPQQLGGRGRLVDQQFQEVISIDFGDSHGPNIDSSVSQIAMGNLDYATDEKNLLPPQHKFELSTFTDQQSKLFADDLAISGMGELTDKISFNFSSMQPLSDKNDDLDEMEKDLMNRSSNRANIVYQGPNMGNSSEYIEVDLNTTRIAAPNEQSDMSITDTIHSPEVQDVSKSTNSISNEKPGKDWVVDKENIVLNPYIAPKESDNFAVNEELDKILVFDGKRLTIQSDRDLNFENSPEDNDQKKTQKRTVLNVNDDRDLILKNSPDYVEAKKTQRKTIVLNVNDDLPNFVDDVNATQLPNFVEYDSLLQTPKGGLSSKTIAGNESGLTTTQLLSQMLDMTEPEVEPKLGSNVPVTQAKPCDISMTQAVPARIILPDNSEKRKTIVYQTDAGNISVTQPVPLLLLPGCESPNERQKTIVYEDEAGNVSVTQAVKSHIFLPNDTNIARDKRRTIVFETNSGDISITQAVPSNLIMAEKKKVYDSGAGNLSVTSSNNQFLREASERRRTILYADEAGNVSMTQAISNNMVIEHVEHVEPTQKNKKETIAFQNVMTDISTTQVVDRNSVLSQLLEESEDIRIAEFSTMSVKPQMDTRDKRMTIVFDADAADISMTQAIPSNILAEQTELKRRRTVVLENDNGDVSITRPITSNVFLESTTIPVNNITAISVKPQMDTRDKKMTIVFDADAADISMTQAIPSNILAEQTESKRRTVIFENDDGDISVTRPITSNVFLESATVPVHNITAMSVKPQMDTQDKRMTIVFDADAADISMTQAIPSIILAEQTELKRRRTVIFENDDGDISVTRPITSNVFLESATVPVHNITAMSVKPQMDTQDKRMTIVFDADAADISMTQAIPSNILAEQTESKRRTVIFENDDRDVSVTRPITSNVFLESVTVPVHNITASQGNSIETPITTSVDSLSMNPVSQINSEDTDTSLTLGSDESKVMSNISSRTFGNHSLHTDPTSIDYSRDLISDSKTEIFDTCLKMVSLTKNAMKTTPIRPQAQHMVNTVIYQTSTEPTPKMKPKLIEVDALINADKINELREKASHIAPIIDMVNVDQVKHEVADIEKDEYQREGPELKESEIKTILLKTSCETISYNLSKIEHDLKNALLCDLLDMSKASVDIQGDGYDDKGVTAKIESANLPVTDLPKSLKHAESGESFFYIKDEDDGMQSDYSGEEKTTAPKLEVQLPLQIEFKKPENKNNSPSIPTKPEPVNITVKRSPPNNRHFEEIHSPDFESSWQRNRKSVKDADNTKELLEMLSNFTDKEEEENPIQPLTFKSPLALEMKKDSNSSSSSSSPKVHKNEYPEIRHSPRRHSVAFNREDLLNNISMAQSMLQKSQVPNESTLNETHDSTLDLCVSPKTIQVPGDVVKTLRFDGESFSDSSVRIEVLSPLKKTAFGETTYMREKKRKVIPGYLKDVSEGLKQLMTELVKPRADIYSFSDEIELIDRKASTCSVQVEANLITSSQIDIDCDMRSDETSVGSRIRKGIIKPFTPPSNPKSPPVGNTNVKPPDTNRRPPEIVFDHDNPLNNVLLAPIDFSAAHRYHPPSQESLVKESYQEDSKEIHDRIVEACVQQQFSHIPGGDASAENSCQERSRSSILSRNECTSIDDGTDTSTAKLKNSKVNTIIAMKENKQLLLESSSLTFIDENRVDTNSSGENITLDEKQSPVEMLCTMDQTEYKTEYGVQLDILCEELKTKKRPYSPNKKKNSPITNLNTTQKKTSKIRKISKDANGTKTPTRHLSNSTSDHSKVRRSKSPVRPFTPSTISPAKQKSPSVKVSPNKDKCKRPGTQFMVQQLVTEYHVATGFVALPDSGDVLEILKRQSNTSSSSDGVALSMLQPAGEPSSLMDNTDSVPCTESAFSKQDQSPMDWQPELINELSSKNVLTDCDSGVDVLAKIDVLPFMGSGECSWELLERCAWSFSLLHGRLRLALRLASDKVRGDTPVTHVALDAIINESEAIPSLCVSFALEAMRSACSRVTRARHVPALLRRCAGVSRVALRWAHAMHSARARLAFGITPDGHVTLKVANVALHSVWEVSLQLAMTADGREAPCPRATRVAVGTVLGRAAPHADVARLLQAAPSDWGHAPNVIWKLFKYLKNKPADSIM